uniref:RAB3GAP2_C domain-containing protein n=1 Tax=Globodera pallida TaxID=36090 RepID=A0A183BIH6_GLOPA
MLPSTSTDKLKERNKRTTDESDSDSDVFGDFEMANQTATNDSNGICAEEANSSTEAAQNRPLQNSPSSDQKVKYLPFTMQISQLLEETWKASKTEFDDILQVPLVDAPMANLFSLFSTDGADELTEIDGLTLKSFRLWEQICHLEETRLLQIRWDNSRGSELLMKALSSTVR